MSETTVPATAEETVTPTTEETEINATPEETIFVNLFKNTYEKNGKNLISYKPGYVKKDGSGIGTFPVGFGRFDIVKEKTADGKEYVRNDYDRKFWLSIESNDKTPEKGEILVTLNEVDTKEYQKFFLKKKLTKEGKVGYGVEKPIEIAGTNYRVNLSQNTNKERVHLFNLVFKDAGEGVSGGLGSEEEIGFDDTPDF